MIVDVVQKVDACMDCPNMYHIKKDIICRAAMRGIGNEMCLGSMLDLRNGVHKLCPYREKEVNRRPQRRKVG